MEPRGCRREKKGVAGQKGCRGTKRVAQEKNGVAGHKWVVGQKGCRRIKRVPQDKNGSQDKKGAAR
jgi:hypothetical protein